jgi:hypothetical protein
MGYEIFYHYYPRKDNSYDVQSPQVLTKHLGKTEEVPVEKLANVVMMQLARRDIMIFDVEIHEFVKRKISYRETKGGIIIKNKKFMLDGAIEVIAEEEQEETQEIKPSKPMQNPIRWEVYDPDPMLIPSLSKYKLTPKRKYPLMEEKTVIQRVNVPNQGMTEMPGYEYVVIDDSGQKTRVAAMHFTPEQKPLIGMENMAEDDYMDSPRLMHMGNHFDNGMPVIRR